MQLDVRRARDGNDFMIHTKHIALGLGRLEQMLDKETDVLVVG